MLASSREATVTAFFPGDTHEADKALLKNFGRYIKDMDPSIVQPLVDDLVEPFDERSREVARLLASMPARVRKQIV